MTTSRDDERGALAAAYEAALAYLAGLDQAHVAGLTDLQTLRGRFLQPLPARGVPAAQVIRDLVVDATGGLHGTAGGRFFGWVIGGSVPAALAADWLTSAWDQNAGMYAVAPAAAVVEEAAGAWLKELFGLPDHAAFALVTGCQMAHFTGLAAARHGVLADHGWDVETRGLFGAPPVRILCNGEKHGSVTRAVRFLGLGTDQIVDLATDAIGRTEPADLEAALRLGGPTIVILQAGDINTGSFDDFPSLIPLARSAGAWIHIDGAFGLWAAASGRHRGLVEGMNAADSWATDGHKWLNVPYDCGYVFTARPDAHHAAMAHHAAYLSHHDVARDQIDWNPEYSRRARGFATCAALRELGREGIEALIDRCCTYATEIVEGIGRLPGAEVLARPIINQGLIRFRSPARGATAEEDDAFTDAVIAAILETGEAFFTGSSWHGRRVMRVSVCNWRTGTHDVDRAVHAAEIVLHQLAARRS